MLPLLYFLVQNLLVESRQFKLILVCLLACLTEECLASLALKISSECFTTIPSQLGSGKNSPSLQMEKSIGQGSQTSFRLERRIVFRLASMQCICYQESVSEPRYIWMVWFCGGGSGHFILLLSRLPPPTGHLPYCKLALGVAVLVSPATSATGQRLGCCWNVW